MLLSQGFKSLFFSHYNISCFSISLGHLSLLLVFFLPPLAPSKDWWYSSFFLLVNIKMISVIKTSFKVYQLALTQKFDDISIPLGISRPSLVSLCPARRRLSGITEFLKSNGNGKIFSDFKNLIQVPLVAFLGC